METATLSPRTFVSYCTGHFKRVNFSRVVLYSKNNFRVEEVTGVWFDCDTNIDSFDRCLFHQAIDDNLNYDSSGTISRRGSVKISTPPQHTWGSKCLSIRIKASASFTINVFGTDSQNRIYRYYEETVSDQNLNGEKIVNFLVRFSHISLYRFQ